MGLKNINTIAIIGKKKHPAAYLRYGVLGVLKPSLYATSPLALESLKDQLGFLVTIILGGDSLFTKQRPRHYSPHGEGRRDIALSWGYDTYCPITHNWPNPRSFNYKMNNLPRGL